MTYSTLEVVQLIEELIPPDTNLTSSCRIFKESMHSRYDDVYRHCVDRYDPRADPVDCIKTAVVTGRLDLMGTLFDTMSLGRDYVTWDDVNHVLVMGVDLACLKELCERLKFTPNPFNTTNLKCNPGVVTLAKGEFAIDSGFADLHLCTRDILTHVVEDVKVEGSQDGTALFQLLLAKVLDDARISSPYSPDKLVSEMSFSLGIDFVRPAYDIYPHLFRALSPYSYGVSKSTAMARFFSSVVYSSVPFPELTHDDVTLITSDASLNGFTTIGLLYLMRNDLISKMNAIGLIYNSLFVFWPTHMDINCQDDYLEKSICWAYLKRCVCPYQREISKGT